MRRLALLAVVGLALSATTACGGDTPGATETVTAQPSLSPGPTTTVYTPGPTVYTASPPASSTPRPTTEPELPVECPPNDGTQPALGAFEPPRATTSSLQPQACKFAGMWLLQADKYANVKPIQTIYKYGLAVCASKRGSSALIQSLIKIGYNAMSANALYSAAVTTICPERDPDKKFRTQLDIDAEEMRASLKGDLAWIKGPPKERWIYGEFAQAVCNQLTAHNTSGLNTYLADRTNTEPRLGLLAYEAIEAGSEKKVHGTLTLAAVEARCPTYVAAVERFFDMV